MATRKTATKKTAGKKAGAKRKTAAAKTADNTGVVKVCLRDVRLAPQKARLVVNLIKGKQVEPALQILQFSPKKGAALALKLLKSAISNAREHKGLDVDKLWITAGWVDMGRTMKRWIPRAQGRATELLHRSSHIHLELREK